MKSFAFPEGLDHVVCFGAHPDDIEIGAFGLLATIAEKRPEARFSFVIAAGDDQRSDEARSSAAALLGDRVTVAIGGFRDTLLPYDDPVGVKDFARKALPGSVDLVIAPHHADAHQDHRFVRELAGQLCRDQAILEYEIVKFDGGLASPNVYVPVPSSLAHRKPAHLAEHFSSQKGKTWFDPEVFLGLMRVRGVECNAPDGYAESFFTAKVSVG